MGTMTQASVQEMRRMYGEGMTQGALARHFGLGIAQVGRIVRGECWNKGVGLRMPTQAESDATLRRLMEAQERVKGKAEMRELFGEDVDRLEGKGPPPMLLDGGDTAETPAQGLVRLGEVAGEFNKGNVMLGELNVRSPLDE